VLFGGDDAGDIAVALDDGCPEKRAVKPADISV